MELRNEMLLGMNDVSELTLGKRSFYSLDLFFMRTAKHLARNDLGNNMRMLVMSNRQSQSSWTKRCFVSSSQWLTLSHDSHWLRFTCSIFFSRTCYHPFITLVCTGWLPQDGSENISYNLFKERLHLSRSSVHLRKLWLKFMRLAHEFKLSIDT